MTSTLVPIRCYLITERFDIDRICAISQTIEMLDLYTSYIRTHSPVINSTDNYERAIKVVGK